MERTPEFESVKHCSCGAPARIENGQRWDDGRRKYIKCFRVSCWRCGECGPVKEDKNEAVNEWNRIQKVRGNA